MNEKWNTVSNCEGHYEISNHGIARSLDRVITRKASRTRGAYTVKLKGRELKPSKDGSGYLTVKICVNGRKTLKTIHRLVLETFVGSANGMQCNHIDGLKANNHIENLEWVTSSENNLHKCRILEKGRGGSNGMAKLTESQVVGIRKRYALGGITQAEIAKVYRVTKQTIQFAISRKTWRHVA